MKRTCWATAALFLAAVLLCCGACSAQTPVVGSVPQDAPDEYMLEVPQAREETWVSGLDVPWSLVFLPDGRALVSERGGRIRLIRGGRLAEEPYATLEVAAVGEGGLMGLAVHPYFTEQPFIYAMHTYQGETGPANRVIRLRDGGDTGEVDGTVLDRIPGGRVHNGGRIAFGPDNMLYVTTGDVWQRQLAQDRRSLAGKILRVTPDGAVPADNPFPNSPVWSLGHRNPQGLAWHPTTGDLFASEHGPSGEGGVTGKDEINVIAKGGNYGWPEVVGAAARDRFVPPIVMWDEAVPPAGMAFMQNDLFVATLGSRALVRIELRRTETSYNVERIERWYASEGAENVYGRLRDAVRGPDGALYVLTSNRDGRGASRSGDDRILRITLSR